MYNMNYQTWVDFYSEFASKLVHYKNNRNGLIEIMKAIFADTSLEFPRLEEDGSVNDIDPFTVFGMFNKGIKDENRISILKGIAKKFEITTTVPNEFNGIPVLNNLSSCFFGWQKDRLPNDINNLWDMFEVALQYADNQIDESKVKFIQTYNKVIKQRQVKWNLSMGLYWIRAYSYINLDDRNRTFICDEHNMPDYFIDVYPSLKKKYIPDGTQYLDLCEQGKLALLSGNYEYNNFPELSYYAWKSTKDKSDRKTSAVSFLKWFKPVVDALKELDGSGTPKEVRAQIIKDLNLSDDVVSETRGKNNVNKFENEVAFARNYLVYEGIIDKTVHGIWTLTHMGASVQLTDEYSSQIFEKWVALNKSKRDSSGSALADEDIKSIHFWVYSPGDNASKWDEFYTEGIMGIGWDEIGDLKEFTAKDDMIQKMKESYGAGLSHKNSAHAIWQFANEMRIGDVVFAKKGKQIIVGKGIVDSDHIFDDKRKEHKNIRNVKWINHGELEAPVKLAMKTLTDITAYTDDVSKLNELFGKDTQEEADEKEVEYPTYTEQDFLNEVYLNEDNYAMLVNVLKIKKNIILQGVPGVGKTYAAKRLAYSIMGARDIERVMMVQFHQSYSYEDFIMGFRPTLTGFEVKKGPFYKFCKKAEVDSDNDYFFIIDEINRGNLSKIFGELFMLIENDKRGVELQLLYSDEKFTVPDNIYIIGMMNTADRSIAMLDYALRRRFAFFELIPAFKSVGFKKYLEGLHSSNLNNLIAQIEQLNVAIDSDESLGQGFKIGHSYFCNSTEVTDAWLNSIIDFEIVPLLNEYWFDEPTKIRDWSQKLKGAIK